MNIKNLLVFFSIIASPALATSQNVDDAYDKMIGIVKEKMWLKPSPMFARPWPEGKNKEDAYIPNDEAKDVLRYGIVSGRAEACGLDWKTHFKELMAYERSRGRNEYQPTYIALLHGIATASVKKHPCAPEEKEQLQGVIKRNIAHFNK